MWKTNLIIWNKSNTLKRIFEKNGAKFYITNAYIKIISIFGKFKYDQNKNISIFVYFSK